MNYFLLILHRRENDKNHLNQEFAHAKLLPLSVWHVPNTSGEITPLVPCKREASCVSQRAGGPFRVCHGGGILARRTSGRHRILQKDIASVGGGGGLDSPSLYIGYLAFSPDSQVQHINGRYIGLPRTLTLTLPADDGGSCARAARPSAPNNNICLTVPFDITFTGTSRAYRIDRPTHHPCAVFILLASAFLSFILFFSCRYLQWS